MENAVCWGIFRERQHSPGREDDDERILKSTARLLQDYGYRVNLIDPVVSELSFEEMRPRIFLMCEQRDILAALARIERRGGILVSSPSSVLNTYRERMARLVHEAGVPFPEHEFTSTSGGCVATGPVWVKRADVHNTHENDVVFVPADGDAAGVLEEMAARGIERAMVQRHVPGDLIKFYGVGDPFRAAERGVWFRWFYHKDQDLAGYRFDPSVLKTLACRAAGAVGLEIFGGDAIVTREGDLFLIDINAWPSFALYREEASHEIADHLALRFSRKYAAKRA